MFQLFLLVFRRNDLCDNGFSPWGIQIYSCLVHISINTSAIAVTLHKYLAKAFTSCYLQTNI